MGVGNEGGMGTRKASQAQAHPLSIAEKASVHSKYVLPAGEARGLVLGVSWRGWVLKRVVGEAGAGQESLFSCSLFASVWGRLSASTVQGQGRCSSRCRRQGDATP